MATIDIGPTLRLMAQLDAARKRGVGQALGGGLQQYGAGIGQGVRDREQRNFAAEQALLNRNFQRGERIGAQEFQSGQLDKRIGAQKELSQAERASRAAEAEAQRIFGAGEAEKQRGFTANQALLDRQAALNRAIKEFEFRARQNELSREGQMNLERMRQEFQRNQRKIDRRREDDARAEDVRFRERGLGLDERRVAIAEREAGMNAGGRSTAQAVARDPWGLGAQKPTTGEPGAAPAETAAPSGLPAGFKNSKEFWDSLGVSEREVVGGHLPVATATRIAKKYHFSPEVTMFGPGVPDASTPTGRVYQYLNGRIASGQDWKGALSEVRAMLQDEGELRDLFGEVSGEPRLLPTKYYAKRDFPHSEPYIYNPETGERLSFSEFEKRVGVPAYRVAGNADANLAMLPMNLYMRTSTTPRPVFREVSPLKNKLADPELSYNALATFARMREEYYKGHAVR